MRELFSLPFITHAFAAGSLAAVVAAVSGFFLISRGLTFAGHALPNIANAPGKLRRWDDTLLFASTNWLVNGQLTSSNFLLWDADNCDGFLGSTNVFRYSRNVLLGINAQWFLGRSGRYTDIADGIFSRAQRTNEIEATFQYEI